VGHQTADNRFAACRYCHSLSNHACQIESCIMAGLVPAIHVFSAASKKEDVDARHEAGHDD
jgi:hypothetical protein